MIWKSGSIGRQLDLFRWNSGPRGDSGAFPCARGSVTEENVIIPPLSEKKRKKLERRADEFLDAACDEVWEQWPGRWPEGEESEFERIAAAHTGMVPLSAAPIVAALPGFDPQTARSITRNLMQERPGAGESSVLAQFLDATDVSDTYGSGFAVERRNFPSEQCRWSSCAEPLYAPEASRGRGKPRKYCTTHKKAASTRRKARQRRGVLVGRNRNLVYRFHGLEQQDLSGYRELWSRVNTPTV